MNFKPPYTFSFWLLALLLLPQIVLAQTTLPIMAVSGGGCTISSELDAATKKGPVNPPDNLVFKQASRTDPCLFYERAQQMFLWLTSPRLQGSGAGEYVFNSQMFYNTWSAGSGGRNLVDFNTDAIEKG